MADDSPAQPRSGERLDDAALLSILESQGYRELVSAHLFAGGVAFAPTVDDKQMLADHAREELHHFEAVSAVYEDLSGEALEGIVGGRVAGFPRPSSWLETAIAGFLFDRAVFCQLKSYEAMGDNRLYALVLHIIEHEREHQKAAEATLRDLCRTPAFVPETAQEHLYHWLSIARRALDWSSRDAEETFIESVGPVVRDCGLSLGDTVPGLESGAGSGA